jgi:hypothetical protein
MYIGLGCALENLLLAAKANGYDYRLRLMPDVTVFWFTGDQQCSRISDLIIQATEAIIADKQQSAASAALRLI